MTDEKLRETELVSAYLDGEATPAEIAEVEQTDALQARIEQLRSVRDAVAAPVASVSEQVRDRMISAALAVADAEAAPADHKARVVPILRRRETLLAVAAATILVAAVVTAGLIADRGSDDSLEVAADASAEFDVDDMAAAAEMDAVDSAESGAPAEGPTEEVMAAEEADEAPRATLAPEATSAQAEAAQAAAASAEAEAAEEVATTQAAAAAEEPAAQAEAALAEEPAAQAEAALAEEPAAQAEAVLAEAIVEAAIELPEEPANAIQVAGGTETDQLDTDARRTDDDAAWPVVDLGSFESLEILFDSAIAGRWFATVDDGAMTESGTCSAAVHKQAGELGLETGQSFIAEVGAEDPLSFDGRFTLTADGGATIIYAAAPGCETEIYKLDAPDSSQD